MSHAERAHTMTTEEVVELLVERDDLKRQLAWLRQQLFGTRSERRPPIGDEARQLFLGEVSTATAAPVESTTIAEHQRRRCTKHDEATQESLRFDPSVPVEEIHVPPPELGPDHEIIGEKITYRLAQRPGVYVVLKFIRPVIKRRADGVITSSPAPPSPLGKSLADVSLLACLICDKFLYHLPLYRQHLRMKAAGIQLARSNLTSWVHHCGDLLEPIAEAHLRSILEGNLVTMDETPIRACQELAGKMKTGYFWPIYGDRHEVVFPFSQSRSAQTVRDLLAPFKGVLLTDGYAAYESFVRQVNAVVHALCWSHTRRQFLKAEEVEPELTARVLEMIQRLYKVEALIQAKLACGEKQIELRAERSKPIVDEFFEWLKTVLSERVLLPRNPFTEAAHYALERESGLRVFLSYPDVPIDTNHLEREIRPIALGRRNWLFCWTEIGARYVGVFQSLLATCRLQGVDPYTYLVDVLQRVESHPMSDVAALTPRLWKERFAQQPLRSAIDRVPINAFT
jgi:transposase